jgi:hypothetical protein
MRVSRQSALFLLLSLCSSVVELSVVFVGISRELPIPWVVALGLAYQLGNLVPNPIDIGPRVRDLTSITAMAAAGVLCLDGWNLGVFLAVTAALGAVIQSLRKLAKDAVETTLKRAFRICGFLLAPLVSPVSIFVMAAGLAVISLGSSHNEGTTRLRRPRLRYLSLVMVVHQMHYFSYVYFITPVVLTAAGSRLLLAGLYFALGWLTYTSVPHLLRGTRYRRYFVTGHLFLAVALIAMAFTHSALWLTAIWIATGFGGGTVFCLEKFNQRSGELSKSDFSLAENVGHVLGVMAGLTAYLISEQTHAPIVLAGGAALAAAALLIIDGKRIRRRARSGGVRAAA